MTLGPTILLPPLYEIQRNIQQIKDKYGGNMILNVLDEGLNYDKNSTNAPRAVVFGFLSMLSEQLFRFNILKSTIREEKKLKKRIAIAMLTVSIFVILIGCGVLLYIIIERLKLYKDIVVTKVESSYFMFATLVFSAYLLFIIIMMYLKNKIMYDKYYEVDTLFNNETSIQHITSMLTPETGGGVFKQLQKRKYSCKGINPLIGYFLKLNRNFDVKYTFHPDPINHDLGIKDALRERRVFHFSDKKNPYKLTSDSLLKNDNLPATIVDESNKYVDPFIQGNNLIGDPEIFKKKLQKYDIYGQYARITDAITYFESILSRNDLDGANINEEVLSKVSDKLKHILRIDNIIVTNEIAPCREFLMNANSKDKLELITLDDFVVVAMSRQSDYAYYSFKERTGYIFDKSAMENCIFVLKYTDANTNSDTGYNFFRNIDDFILHIAMKQRPEKLSTQFQPKLLESNKTATPLNSVFEVSIDLINGKIDEIDLETVKIPKNGLKPSIKDVFGPISSAYDDNIVTKMIVYKISSSNYVIQSRKVFLEPSFKIIKPYLYESILNTIGEIDPSYTVLKIDNSLSNEVIDYLDIQIKNDTSLIKTQALDFMYDLPAKIEERAARQAFESNLSDQEQNLFQKYIPYQMFAMQLRNMKKDEFIDKFMYNVDVLRHTSGGLKKIHDKYDYGRELFSKNQMMLESTFIIVIVLGLCEVIHQAWLQSFQYMCTNIEHYEKEDRVRKEFRILSEDNAQTRIVKQRAIDKKLARITIKRNKVLSNKAFYISLLIVIYLVSVAYIYAWKERSRNLFNYNNYVLESNGNRIVIDSEQVLQHMTHLIVNKKQFVFLQDSYEETGDIDELYPLLKRHSLKEKEVVHVDEETQTRNVYNKLVDIIESYHKCNLLMDNRHKNIPFPIFETSMYFVIICITTIIILYGFLRLHPLTHYYNLKNWSKIQELMNKDIEIDPRSFGFACDEPPQKKRSVENALTYIAAAVLLVVGILFTIALFQNTNTFSTSLYNSPMFRDLQCYNK